ncbi:MAG: mannose-1-phosphate guanylyltransferase/mannose-6-phosphate isomerase [Acidimicrobiia bacterium]
MSPDESPIVPIILSGGMGTRMWPASRRSRPKQLLALIGNRTMIGATARRAKALGRSGPVVVTNEDHAGAIAVELEEAGIDNPTIILEPVGRNTAPAVTAAALAVTTDGTDPLMLVLPSDHVISNEAAFAEAVTHAVVAANEGYLVTFGISPSRPETGYGYIRVGDRVTEDVRTASEFREKPDEATAASYLASGTYLWNSGMFLFRASVWLEEIEQHAPEIAAGTAAAWDASVHTPAGIALGAAEFSAISGDSIDYAVMEHTARAAVVPTDPGWSDVGSWTSLWDIADHDTDGNVLSGDVITVGAKNSLISADSRLVAAVGTERLVIVETADAVLVAAMDDTQSVKDVVDELTAAGRPEVEGVTRNPATHRLAGSTPHRIEPSPHERRLVIVSGTGTATIGTLPHGLSPGVTVAVPASETGSVVSEGSELLEFVEIEIRRRPGSDDINRGWRLDTDEE